MGKNEIIKKDMLDEIFKNQQILQDRIAFKLILTDSDKQQYINQMVIALVEESMEILRCTKYKNPEVMKFGWKKTQENNFEHMKEELVDLQHFLVNLALVIGMDSKEFFEIYCKKNKINHVRKDEGY